MTTDRRKAILFLAITLVIGILIGSMVPGMFGRFRHRGGKGEKEGKEMRQGKEGREGRGPRDRKEWLTKTVIRVVKPDSAQVKEIRPLTSRAAQQIGELEKNSNERMIVIMDSLKLKLRPILSEEQNKKLEDFSAKARQRWKKKD